MKHNEFAVLNFLRESAVILDEFGNIVFKNRSWYNSKNSLSLCNGKCMSENYFKHCSQAVQEGCDYALRLLLGIRDTLDKKKECFNISVYIPSENTDRCFKVEIFPVQDELEKHAFSIAKVHEVLYDKEDIAEISFTDYLTSIVETLPDVAETQDFNIHVEDEETPLILNVNQAIALGMLINEIMNLTPPTIREDQLARLSFNYEGKIVTISISGLKNQIEVYNSDSKNLISTECSLAPFYNNLMQRLKSIKPTEIVL